MKIKFGNLYEYNKNIYLSSEDIKKKIILRSNEIKKAGTIKKKILLLAMATPMIFLLIFLQFGKMEAVQFV